VKCCFEIIYVLEFHSFIMLATRLFVVFSPMAFWHSLLRYLADRHLLHVLKHFEEFSGARFPHPKHMRLLTLSISAIDRPTSTPSSAAARHIQRSAIGDLSLKGHPMKGAADPGGTSPGLVLVLRPEK
jgi:hypothetical protein